MADPDLSSRATMPPQSNENDESVFTDPSDKPSDQEQHRDSLVDTTMTATDDPPALDATAEKELVMELFGTPLDTPGLGESSPELAAPSEQAGPATSTQPPTQAPSSGLALPKHPESSLKLPSPAPAASSSQVELASSEAEELSTPYPEDLETMLRSIAPSSQARQPGSQLTGSWYGVRLISAAATLFRMGRPWECKQVAQFTVDISGEQLYDQYVGERLQADVVESAEKRVVILLDEALSWIYKEDREASERLDGIIGPMR